MANAYERARVVKRLSATQPGALKLARRFGDALVCVRYRHDIERRHRYTTVELVVDQAPIARRQAPLDAIVLVRIPFSDTARQNRARTLGAKWDSRDGVWYMRRSTAKQLGLLKQIVEK
ncbi:MAG: hypothetical protein E6H58_17900 [Betaproteobacteria bacterium]|nr:MAG: hypothetical protein E6H65_15805 [Betaproteobacteria bacterium]TMH28404.1 MAG: hypothetical protein E6H58_17900 [Betaproteobacteria bacterium]